MTELLLPGLRGQADSASPRAMMIVDDAHVTYRVYASGKRLSARDTLLSSGALRGGRGLQTVPALRGVSFTAVEGETIGVIGHNGSGKSTLFRAMSGLLPTSQGSIWAADRPVLLGVNAALMPELSGENNIKLGLLAMGFTPEEAAAQVDQIADFAELNEFLYHPMRTYSSGMGARLRFAIASAKAHSILLIDEALSVGDRRFKIKSEERIRGLKESAGLVMIVSHSAGALRDTCERVLWIHKGELRADGPAKAIIDDYVTWTKQPGSVAVGAASASKTSAPTKQKTKSSVSLAPSPVGAALAASVSGETGRAAERRARFRRTENDRRQRRIIAAVTTGVAILLAAGAGAAIAILNIAPAPAPSISSPTPEIPGPTIESFTAVAASAVCDATEGKTNVPLSWKVAEDSTRVAVAVGGKELDAIEKPLHDELPLTAAGFTVTFPCNQASRAYTLTAENAAGGRTSAVVIVSRTIGNTPTPTATPTPTPTRETSGNTGGGDSGGAVNPAPVPIEPEPTTNPEPQPEPTTEPEPEPTVTPEPEPEPEPTTVPEPTTPPAGEIPSVGDGAAVPDPTAP